VLLILLIPDPSNQRHVSAAAHFLGFPLWIPRGSCMDVCLLWVSCVVRWRSLRWADHPSWGVLLRVVCLNVVVKP